MQRERHQLASIHTMFHDWSYEVQAIDARGVRLPVDGVEAHLLDIIRDVELREAAGESPVPVGRLTTEISGRR